MTFGVPTTKEAARRIGLVLTRVGIPERHAHTPTKKHRDWLSTLMGRAKKNCEGDLTNVSKGDWLASEGVGQHNCDLDVGTNVQPTSLLIERAGEGLGTSEQSYQGEEHVHDRELRGVRCSEGAGRRKLRGTVSWREEKGGMALEIYKGP